MSVPSVITDLTATASGNFPLGSDNVFPELDDFLRAHASFIKQLDDGKADLADLTATTVTLGDALITVKRTETGAIATTQHVANQSRPLDAVMDFGCDNTGATNTTTALKAFYDACIDNQVPGYIPAGTYKITTGVFAWDTGFTDKLFPTIDTPGYKAVTFLIDPATDTDEPIFAWTNGIANSGAGRYWLGGRLGGFTIQDSTGATAPNRHGLLLRGIWGTEFGWIRGNDLRANLIHCEKALYNGTTGASEIPRLGLSGGVAANNPDPYALTFVTFKGVEANRIKGIPFANFNYVGLNLCTIEVLRSVSTEGAAQFYGCGAANVVKLVSSTACKGWVVDDGMSVVEVQGGRPEFFTVEAAEWDAPEFGLRLNGLQRSRFTGRFIHRIPFAGYVNPLQPSTEYWPKVCVDLGGGPSPAAQSLFINTINRIESGGIKSQMGVFVDGNSVASSDIFCELTVLDNAAFGFADSDLFTGISTSSQILLTRVGKPITDTRLRIAAIAKATVTTTVPASASWATSGAIMVYNAEDYDLSVLFDTTTGGFTVPFTGVYRVTHQFRITAASGTLLRCGVLMLRSAAYSLIGETFFYKTNASAEDICLTRTFYLNQGDVLFPAGACSAGATAVTAGISFGSANFFCVEAV